MTAIAIPDVEVSSTRESPGRRMRASSGRAPTSSSGEAVFGLGMIGALAYFLGTASSTRDRFLAVGKAMVWPAILVHRAFTVLGE